MKKILSFIMLFAVCLTAASCGGTGSDITSGSNTDTSDVFSDTLTTKQTEQSAQTTTTGGSVSPDVEYGENDVTVLDVGRYVKLVYNPAYCHITTSVEKGVGSRETVTLEVQMKDGYIFDGWSLEKAMDNGASRASRAEKYTLTVSNETMVWTNYSVSLVYHANGGETKNGSDTYTQHFSAVWYKCPSTLRENGYFTREGYTLVEYNTKADGSGTPVSLGSRVAMNECPSIDLYCIWEKQNDESDFEVTVDASAVTISKYIGSSENVVIPDSIKGKPVIGINNGAFSGTNVERVVLSKNVKYVAPNAFSNCNKLETFVMFDSLMEISDSSFEGTSVKNLRVNAALDMYDSWTTSWSNSKLDRLIWAKSNGADVVAIYGGSGAYYGFDCEAIDKALEGKYEIVNLGSNANVSASIYFEYLSSVMDEGDIVLWTPEAGDYVLGIEKFSQRAWEFNAGHYDILRNIDISEYEGVFSSYSSYAASHASAQRSFEAFDSNTNMYGDCVSERETRNPYCSYSYKSYVNSLENGTYSYIAGIIKDMSGKGIRIYYTYAAMSKDGTGFDDAIMADYESALLKAFPEVTVISEYKDCLVDNDQIYDSVWHLTLDGAKARTEVVIHDLVAQLEKEEG